MFELGLHEPELGALSLAVVQFFEYDHFASGCRVVPLCDASEGTFTGNFLSSTFTCALKYSGLRWAYRCVIRIFRCPSSFCTTSKSTPFMTSQLAKQWRRSCHRKLVIPARFTAVCHPFLISRIASPAS